MKLPVLPPAKDGFIQEEQRIAIQDKQAVEKPEASPENRGKKCCFTQERDKSGRAEKSTGVNWEL